MHIEIYSPAPEHTETHRYNMELANLITESEAAITASSTSLALPDSVNRLSGLDADTKANELVLVNHFDFLCAVEQKGPEWHSYDRTNTDLKFVANLFGAGIGFVSADPAIKLPSDLRGKRISVLPRPSAVRAIAEIVLRDGWGVLHQVELVDGLPRPGIEISPSISCEVRVVTTIETQGGYKLVEPFPEGSVSSMSWIDIDRQVIDQMTAVNSVTFDRVLHPPLVDGTILPFDQGSQSEAGLVRFDEGLSAWGTTDPDFVSELLGLLLNLGNRWAERTGSTPFDVKHLRSWSTLKDSYIHQGSKQFFLDHRP